MLQREVMTNEMPQDHPINVIKKLTFQPPYMHQNHPNIFGMGSSGLSCLCRRFQHTNHQCHACYSEAQTARICLKVAQLQH